MKLIEIFAFSIIGLILLIFFWNHYKILYYRHLKSFRNEIIAFLEKNNLKLIEINSPTRDDWARSPFIKPNNFEISFFVIKVNGMPITWSRKKYKIINAEKENHNQRVFWLEIESTYFKKPKLLFRNGKHVKPTKEKALNKKVKFVQAKEHCPACGYKLSKNEFVCPDCGLNFI